MGNTEESLLALVQGIEGIENVSPIPEGGQSYAYTAFDTYLKRNIFIKIYWYSDEYKDSLLLEPRRLAAIYQDNSQAREHIVNLYAADKVETDGESYILMKMEHCEGRSLFHEIGEFGLSVHESLQIAKELSEGLHFLHSKNIVHRDIKPGNIMIPNGQCKLVDLGSAAILSGNDLSARVTSIKTLYYNPPEAYPPAGQYYVSSDIYQIGVVLHEMLNGAYPVQVKPHKSAIKACESKFKKTVGEFDGFENSELEKQTVWHLSTKRKLLEGLRSNKPYLPNSLRRIIKNCTNPDPNSRYKTCVDLRADLTKLNIPNWKQKCESSYLVHNWKGRDYRITISNKSEFVFESCSAGSQKYRKNKKINDLQSAINQING